jgi:putative tryptophan/tyrosine transport system substrate-binding protein
MRRRDFIVGIGGAAALPLAVRAQQRAERVRRIGALIYYDADGPGFQNVMKGLRDELRSLGWIEDHNLRLDVRYGVDEAQLRSAAEELVRLAPDAIFVLATPAMTAISKATRTIPTIFFAGEPRAVTFAGNVPRPTTNMTGFVINVSSLGGKWLQLLKDAVPSLRRVAIVSNIDAEGSTDYLPTAQTAAAVYGVTATPLVVPRDAVQIEAAFAAFAGQGDAVLVIVPPVSVSWAVFSDAARLRNLPAIAFVREFPAAGGLMSYGGQGREGFRVAASYLDRILRGAKPGDLPVQFATRFELVVNRKTAQAIGLQIPDTFIALTDEVID